MRSQRVRHDLASEKQPLFSSLLFIPINNKSCRIPMPSWSLDLHINSSIANLMKNSPRFEQLNRILLTMPRIEGTADSWMWRTLIRGCLWGGELDWDTGWEAGFSLYRCIWVQHSSVSDHQNKADISIKSMLFFFFFWFPSAYKSYVWGSPGGSAVKNLPANACDESSSLRGGRFPGEGNGNPLQYSCLENPRDRGAWWATVHRMAKSLTRLSNQIAEAAT